MRIGYICLFLAVLTCVFVVEIGGSAFLLDPPGRSALWNFQIRAPVNYNYMSLNCGGKLVERLDNGTVTCGLCGDDIDGPQDNLFDGKYVSRIIFSRFYHQGDVVEFRVWNNNPERGWYEFRLCQNGDKLSQQCLDQNLLFLPEVNDTYYPVREGTGPRTIKVKLPNGLTCNHCVIQWRFHTATEFGCSKDFWCGPGLGPQPEYYNCADVVIGPDGSAKPPTIEEPVFNTLDYGSSYDTHDHNHTTSTPAPTNITTTVEPQFSTDPVIIDPTNPGFLFGGGGFLFGGGNGGRNNLGGFPLWILLIPLLFARRVEPVVRWYTYPIYPIIPVSGNRLSSNLAPMGVSFLNNPLINTYPQTGAYIDPQSNFYGNNLNYMSNTAYAPSGTYYNKVGQVLGGSPGGTYYYKVGQVSGGSFLPNIPANSYGNQIGNTLQGGWNNNLGNNNVYSNEWGSEGGTIGKPQFNINQGVSQGKPLDGGFSAVKKSEPLPGSNVHLLYQGLLNYSAAQNTLPLKPAGDNLNSNKQVVNENGGNLKEIVYLNNGNTNLNFGNVNPNFNPNRAGFVPTVGNQNSNFGNTNFNPNFNFNSNRAGFVPTVGNQNSNFGNTDFNPNFNFNSNRAGFVPTAGNQNSNFGNTNFNPNFNFNPNRAGFVPNVGNQNSYSGNTNLNPNVNTNGANFNTNGANLVPTNTNFNANKMSGYSQVNGIPEVN